MNLPPLNSGFNACLEAMHLKAEDKQTIVNVVKQYTMPNSWSEIFFWLNYRVDNAFKSILGRSDWQVANRLIYNHMLNAVKENKVYEEPPKDVIQLKIKARVIETVYNTSKYYLPLCLNCNEMQREATEEFRKELAGLDLNHIVGQLKKVSLEVTSHFEQR